MSPLKGEIYLVDFFGKGHQQAGFRPAVIVQNDFINQTKIGNTIVCPCTTTLRELPTHPIFSPSSQNGFSQKTAVLCDQIITINKDQLQKKIGELRVSELNELNKSLALVLDI